MGFIYYGEEIAIVSSTRPVRLDIGVRAMKKNVPGSHSSWATRLIIKRLDGPNEGPVEDNHEVGIFSENDETRLDVGSWSMKEEVPSSHVSWATVLKIKTVKGIRGRKRDKKGRQVVQYGDKVGIFSSTADYRLDIGSDAVKPISSSHDSWATRLHIQKIHETEDSGIARKFIDGWPHAAKIHIQVFDDRNHSGLPVSVAKNLWNKSGLRQYKEKRESFDSDDFCYVYKGAVSRYVHDEAMECPYAVGVVFGKKSGAKHACNVFLDEENNVKILEPQDGTVLDGAEWEYTPYFVLI